MNKYWDTIREVALELGHKPATVRKWKSRKRVAHYARRDIEVAAKRKKRTVPYEAFEA